MALYKPEKEEKLCFLLTRLQLNVNKPQDLCNDIHETKVKSLRNSSISINHRHTDALQINIQACFLR